MKVYDSETTCKNILALAKERGWNASRLAKILGVSPQAVSKWSRGIASPSIDMLLMMSDLFEVGIEELIASREADIRFDLADR
ncbi:MAG: helix-turn-helix domain-containing protein [Lachnospiraceae bacterium]|nr:helix-turn-helix domain-containing protein [Lachnospiraceae bacterium]